MRRRRNQDLSVAAPSRRRLLIAALAAAAAATAVSLGTSAARAQVFCDALLAELSNGAVTVTVDGVGAFGGAASLNQPALFDPPGAAGPAETVYTSNLYVSSLGRLLSDCDDEVASELLSQTET